MVNGKTKTLNLYGGTISGGKCVGDNHYGGGVYIENAKFNMYGGSELYLQLPSLRIQ